MSAQENQTTEDGPAETLRSGDSSAPWQPIETAPTNGCEIIAAGLNYDDIKQGYHIVITKHDGAGWLVSDNADSEDYYPYLTHWMPLPSWPNDRDVPTSGTNGEPT